MKNETTSDKFITKRKKNTWNVAKREGMKKKEIKKKFKNNFNPL